MDQIFIECNESLINNLAENYYYNDIDIIEKISQLDEISNIGDKLSINPSIEWEFLNSYTKKFYYDKALEFLQLQVGEEDNVEVL